MAAAAKPQKGIVQRLLCGFYHIMQRLCTKRQEHETTEALQTEAKNPNYRSFLSLEPQFEETSNSCEDLVIDEIYIQDNQIE